MRPARLFAIATVALLLPTRAATFRAGAAISDISPTNFPVIVNAMFTERSATAVVDPLHTRALVLDDGTNRIAIAVVDTCMMPRDLIDAAKEIVVKSAGIRKDRILISATHTHSAPSAMGCLGSRADTNYQKFLIPRIADAIIRANGNLTPAKIGWAVVDDWKHTFNRRWIRRSDRVLKDPFGNETVRANMHPGHQSPDAVGPSGPVDPALSVIALQTKSGEPLALFANYSQHYYESALLSSDYYGKFCGHIANLIGATNSSFVAMMSQGTSGDLMWMDYGSPAKKIGYDAYAREVAEEALRAYQKIEFHDWVPLAMAERKLEFGYRTPDDARLQWARDVAAKLNGQIPKTQPEIYALEAIYFHERPRTELILQALRIGDLGIATLPNEVYALTGLKLKAQSPFLTTINVELANGAEGYIPTPEQHKLGGYTTWPARTAGLEVGAEPKIVANLLELLESVADKPRREPAILETTYSKAVAATKPLAFWRFEEMTPRLGYEDGVAVYLPGMGESKTNHAIHFAGGRVVEKVANLGSNYSAHFWIWNGFPNDVRDVTGYFFSRGRNLDPDANGEHLGIGGKHLDAAGKLILFNGNRLNNVLTGKSIVTEKKWHHVALVREGARAKVYLDGELEIDGALPVSQAAPSDEIFLGGRSDRFAGFEGKMDEAAIYDRALSKREIEDLLATSGMPAQAASRSLSPEESLAKIHVTSGFRVELVVAEPLVVDPVAIDWDAAGRMWVVEMADYPMGMDGKGKPGGRVRLVEDSDGDGKYDRSVVFASGLSFPTGIITWRDGVIVTAAPEILFLKDVDGDGRADLRQILFSGFLEGNQQLRINGLRWGLDNWIYCAVGGHYRGYGAATKIKSHITGKEIALGSRDFRIRPDTGEFEPESGPSQFGRNRDDWGNWFGTQNSNPLWHYVLPDRYLRRNPHVPAPDPTHQVVTPVNPKVFPASPQEKRYHSYEQGGHFTSACAGMIYRDNLVFPGNEMHAFTCEPFHNLVHHEQLFEDGVSFKAQRTASEQKSEFFASSDPWCRPVMTRTGPDGALWVVDMYRYMIEHPDWLPENGREELLPHYRKGDDKGRIYRVLPANALPRKPVRLDKLSSRGLASALNSSNEWQRDKAHQLLLSQKYSVQPLKKLMSSRNALARLHALTILDGLDALDADLFGIAIKDDHEGVRINAIRIAEKFPFPKIDGDDSPLKVRLQLALSLGEWKTAEAGRALSRLAIKNHTEPFIVAAVMSSALPHLETLAKALVAENGPALKTYSEPLYTLCLALDRKDLLETLLNPVVNAKEFTGDHFDQYAAYLQLLARRKIPLPNHPAIIHGAKESLDGPNGFAAATLLARIPAERAAALPVLADSLKPGLPSESQRAAISIIAESGDASTPKLLLKNWATQSPATRGAILEALLRREPWTYELLQNIQPAEIDTARRNRLLKHESPRIRQLAESLFKSAASNRSKVVEQFRPALEIEGDLARGKAVYTKICATCHQRDGQGNEVGPDLRTIVEHPPEKLLTNILDPNADVQPGYHAYNCKLTNGEEIYGLISSESGNSVGFKLADGSKRNVLRSEIQSLQSANLSLMPEGLENGVSPQEMADLIAYLRAR